MKSPRAIALFLIVIAGLPHGQSAVLEALIQIDSENIQMTSFLERFKKFIAQSHVVNSNAIDNVDNQTSLEKYIQHNDTFQANYDFSQNLLTIKSTYNLVQNKTREKISDVTISINFRFDQDPDRKIIIEDFHGNNAEPRIGIDNVTKSKNRATQTEEESGNEEQPPIGSTVLGAILSPIVNLLEPIIVTFFHIVVNGILGHFLTTAFEELYHGRLLSN